MTVPYRPVSKIPAGPPGDAPRNPSVVVETSGDGLFDRTHAG